MADCLDTTAAPARQIAAPADAQEANRIALLRRMWADHAPDGRLVGRGA